MKYFIEIGSAGDLVQVSKKAFHRAAEELKVGLAISLFEVTYHPADVEGDQPFLCLREKGDRISNKETICVPNSFT